MCGACCTKMARARTSFGRLCQHGGWHPGDKGGCVLTADRSCPQEAKAAKAATAAGEEYVAPAQRSAATFLPRLLDDFSESLLTLGVPADGGQNRSLPPVVAASMGTSCCCCIDE